MSDDALFAIVAGGYFFGAFAIMCVIAAIIEAVDETLEKKRRKKFRNNYVRFK